MAVSDMEPEYIIVQPGLDGVAWLGEVIDGEPSPIGKVRDLLDVAAKDAEIAHWKSHAEEAGAGFAEVCKTSAQMSARNRVLARERDDVFAELNAITRERDEVSRKLAAAETQLAAVTQKAQALLDFLVGNGLLDDGIFNPPTERELAFHMGGLSDALIATSPDSAPEATS